MLTLAIECSSPHGGVAITSSEGTLSSHTWSGEKAAVTGLHSEFIIPSIRQVFQYAKHAPKDINFITVDNGPGRFTGVRVAVNCAKSLAYALNIPVMTFSSLEVLAANVNQDLGLDLLCMINAHKNMVYVQKFQWLGERYRPTSKPEAVEVRKLNSYLDKEYVCVGDGYEIYRSFLPPPSIPKLKRNSSLSDLSAPESLGKIGLQDFDPVTALVWYSVQPLYIRMSEAEEKLSRRNN